MPEGVWEPSDDIPLGFPNWMVLVATAILLEAGARPRRRELHMASFTSSAGDGLGAIAVPAAVVLVLGVASAWPATPGSFSQERTDDTTLTVFNWNVHYGVTPDVEIDLEAFARAIEAEDPDVVALQEVSRGWLLGGGFDVATWLSRRLDMGIVYVPAADHQFGNALLSKAELTDVEPIPLPYAGGPMRRSAISATVTLADGTPVRVTSVHIQHGDRSESRMGQLDELLVRVLPDGPSVLAGDFNSTPGSAEIERIEQQGWTSTQDTVGNPSLDTYPSIDPYERIDWVFTANMDIARADVLPDTSSDHRAILITVTPTGG